MFRKHKEKCLLLKIDLVISMYINSTVRKLNTIPHPR